MILEPVVQGFFNIHVQKGARNHHHFVQCMDQALKITVLFGVEVPEPSSCASLKNESLSSDLDLRSLLLHPQKNASFALKPR